MSEELKAFLHKFHATAQNEYYQQGLIHHLVKIFIPGNKGNGISTGDLQQLFIMLNNESFYYTVNIEFKNHNLPE